MKELPCTPFFSVIVPVYEVEDYLDRSIKSVLSQNFNSFEIILVDDGSPDQSGKICDTYADLSFKIKVIHKLNGGASDARNVGLTAATGDYIIFLDGDDYWEGTEVLKDMHEILATKNPDLLVFGSTDVYDEEQISINIYKEFHVEEIEKDKTSAIKSLILNNQFPGAAWKFFVKRKLLTENEIFFIKGIKAEDIDWVLHVFYVAKEFQAVNYNFHRYVKDRSASVTNTADIKSLNDVLFSVDKWYDKLKNENTEWADYLLSYLAFQYLTTYLIFFKLKVKERKAVLPALEKYKSILRYSWDMRSRFIFMIIRIFGISFSAHIMSLAYKLLQKIPHLRTFR